MVPLRCVEIRCAAYLTPPLLPDLPHSPVRASHLLRANIATTTLSCRTTRSRGATRAPHSPPHWSVLRTLRARSFCLLLLSTTTFTLTLLSPAHARRWCMGSLPGSKVLLYARCLFRFIARITTRRSLHPGFVCVLHRASVTVTHAISSHCCGTYRPHCPTAAAASSCPAGSRISAHTFLLSLIHSVYGRDLAVLFLPLRIHRSPPHMCAPRRAQCLLDSAARWFTRTRGRLPRPHCTRGCRCAIGRYTPAPLVLFARTISDRPIILH